MTEQPISREAANELYWKLVLIIEPKIATLQPDESMILQEKICRAAIETGAREKARAVIALLGSFGLIPIHFRPTATPPAFLLAP